MDARRFTGGKSVSILVTVGPDYRSTAELKVIANSRGDIVFNPGEVNFATVSRGQVVTQTVDVEYAGALPWQVTEVLVAKELPLEASFKELYRKPGQVGVRVNVTLKADAPPGALKEYVYLKTNDPAGPLVPVLVEAQVVGAVTVSPSALALGTVKAGEEVTKRVVVRGSKPFKVLGVEGGSDVTLVGELAAEAPAQTVTLKIKPEQAGDFKREVKIRTSLQSEPVVVVIDGSVTP